MANFPVDPADMDDVVVSSIWNQALDFLDSFGMAMIGSPDGYEKNLDHYIFDFGKGLKVRVDPDFDADDDGDPRIRILSVEFFR